MVSIYGNVSGDYMPVWTAADAGYFAQHNLSVDVQMIAGGPQSLAAVLSGQAQVDQVGGSEVMGAVASGADLVAVATLMPVLPYKLYARAGINTPADLKGKKIDVVNFGGTLEVGYRLIFPKLGLNPDADVTFVPTGTHQNGTAALITGAVDARLDNPPASIELEKAGIHSILDVAAMGLPSASTVVVFTRPYLEQHRDVVQAYVDSLVQAIARLKTDQSYALTVLKKYFKSTDDAAMKETYDYFITEIMPPAPFPKAEQFSGAVSVLSAKNPAIAKVDVNRLIDPSFVQSAVDRGLAGAR